MKILQRLASRSAVIFATRLFGAGVIFLTQAAMARIWGAELLGEYLLIFATVNLISVTIPLGFHTVGTYFAAEYTSKKDGRNLRQFVLRAYTHVAIVGVLVAIGGGLLASAFGEAGRAVAEIWWPTAILALATGTVYLNGALLVGFRRPYAGFFAETLFRPLLVVGTFGISIATMTGLTALHGMLWMLAFSYATVAIAQIVLVLNSVAAVPAEQPARPHESRRWWRFAVPWVMVSLASDFFFDIDLLLLSGHMERHELAIFGICTRIFSLVSFGVVAVYSVMLPDMYETGAGADKNAFTGKIREANLIAGGIALALVLTVIAGGHYGLAIFGEDFVSGHLPLSLLCVGLLIRALFGPGYVVLSIHNRPAASLPAVASGMASLFLGNHFLVPLLGLSGAAIAALIAFGIWSVALWLTALRITGMDISIFALFRRDRASKYIQFASRS